MSLGNLFLEFFFGLLYSLSQKFSICCSLFLIFLTMMFLQGNMPTFVLQDTWSNKTLSLGYFGPGFLTFLFRGFLTIYWWTSSLEQLKLTESTSSFGPQAMRHSSIGETRNIFLPRPFFIMTKLRTLRLASTMQPQTDLQFLSPVLLAL